MQKNKLIFIAILIIAFALRFYQLGKIPISLDWDEVSNAYNAYSILKTTRDEYGNFLPLANRSFNDYKPPVYMYLEVPTVAVFGLTPFAARLPSALLGFLTVPVIYFLAKWMFKNFEEKTQETLSLFTTFLFAISPWNIQFSRVGFEANVAFFFAVAGITTTLYGLKKCWLLPISAVILVFSLYSYHSGKLFIPLIYLALIAIFRKEIIKIPKKYLFQFVILSIILVIPIFTIAPKQSLFNRFESTSVQSYAGEVNTSVEFINTDQKIGFPLANLIHNRRLIIAQNFLKSYLKHFDFNFLFVTGDNNERHHAEGMGMLYFFELPLIIFAIYKILSNPSAQYYFIIAWLLIAPVPASLSNEAPHAIRSYIMLIPLELLSSLGFFALVEQFKKFKVVFIVIFSLWILFSISVYLENYYNHYPYDKAADWQYPYELAVLETQKYPQQNVYINSKIEEAYIFWLFYTKYDPASYQKTGSNKHFANYYFESSSPNKSDDIYVADNLNGDFIPLKTFKTPNDQVTITIGQHK